MVKYEKPLDRTFQALANTARRQMLETLGSGPQTIGQLAQPLDMSFAAVSKHVTILEDAGLVRREKQGRQCLCRLRPVELNRAIRWLEQQSAFWSARLDDLEKALQEEQQHE